MDAVRESIADAGVFYVAPDVDLWSSFCGGVAEEFVSRYSSLFNSFVLVRRKSYETHYVEINKANRLARAQQMLVSTSTAGNEASGSGQERGGVNIPQLFREEEVPAKVLGARRLRRSQ